MMTGAIKSIAYFSGIIAYLNGNYSISVESLFDSLATFVFVDCTEVARPMIFFATSDILFAAFATLIFALLLTLYVCYWFGCMVDHQGRLSSKWESSKKVRKNALKKFSIIFYCNIHSLKIASLKKSLITVREKFFYCDDSSDTLNWIRMMR